MRALGSPSIVRPVAFPGDIEVAALFDMVNDAMAAAEILRRLSDRIGLDASVKVLTWMLKEGILQRC